jgi:hypothetical protein
MKLIKWLLTPYHRWQQRRAYKKRMEELRKRDPFIYK